MILGLMLLTPVMNFVSALIRALVLFWPTMVFFGAVHSHLDWVPNLGAEATFMVVALLSLLIPTGDSSNSD